MNGITLVTAVTPSHLGKLRWCLPTWRLKPQFAELPLIIFIHGFGQDGAISFHDWLLEVTPESLFEQTQIIPWPMPEAADDRERMISAFILGAAQHVKTDYFVKLDADCWFTDDKDVFELGDFKHDLVSHRWGYTRPASYIATLDKWGKLPASRVIDKDRNRYNSPRIQSFCCLHKTEFVREAARLAQGRLPVPSHDTYLWWLAQHVNEFSWHSKNLHKLGVGHNAREKKCREDICAKVGLRSEFLAQRLFEHIQLEITTKCNLRCPNCDRNCATAPSDECMTAAQVGRFVKESLDWHTKLDHSWNRIDILGGEPTLHPELDKILALLHDYKKAVPKCKMRFTTNGTGRRVRKRLAKLPKWLKVRNSAKEKGKPDFEAANLAPADKDINRVQACSIPWRCGLALTRYGYYLCGAGASISRVFGIDVAMPSLDDLTLEALRRQQAQLCRLCGHSRSTMEKTQEQKTSKSWQQAFDSYAKSKPVLETY
jgi:hypothetical protein